jgi:hypothetical protein
MCVCIGTRAYALFAKRSSDLVRFQQQHGETELHNYQVNFDLEQAMKAQRRTRGVALLFL